MVGARAEEGTWEGGQLLRLGKQLHSSPASISRGWGASGPRASEGGGGVQSERVFRGGR